MGGIFSSTTSLGRTFLSAPFAKNSRFSHFSFLDLFDELEISFKFFEVVVVIVVVVRFGIRRLQVFLPLPFVSPLPLLDLIGPVRRRKQR